MDRKPARRPVQLELNAVIVAVTGGRPRVLTVGGPGPGNPRPRLPSGPLDPDRDRTLERALRRWVLEQTGLTVGYAEQLYTFGDRERDAGTTAARLVSVAYLALVREGRLPAHLGARWQDCYEFLPWEDRLDGEPGGGLVTALRAWAAAEPAQRGSRGERIDISFGLGDAGWDPDRALERYELAYEAGLVAEAGAGQTFGRPMAADHRRMLATALSRLRGKLRYRPVVFELLPPEFTLLELQSLVEALAGVRLHKQNFRRLVESARLVERTGSAATGGRGRPAGLFRFRREVLRERQGPGVGLPVRRRGDAGRMR